MTAVQRLAFIGNALPRRCGIATFTGDLQDAVQAARPGLSASLVAMNEHGHRHDYPARVTHEIDEACPGDYARVADALNASGAQVACLQHEFGIFGGPAGRHVRLLLDRLAMPLVTTLHTVLAEPDAAQRAVLMAVARASERLVVMAEKGRTLLEEVYGVDSARIEVIPHGIPDVPFAEPQAAKAALGFAGQQVILTFGLLSPSKGIEVVIDAMPMILARCPSAIYVVLGATHPNLLRQHGESYRASLMERAAALGVSAQVLFLDGFVDLPTLLGFIATCDVYATPYLQAEQMTSGTLAYSHGLGQAVVSTPYWHAQELLADGAGTLVPFGDAPATGQAIAGLLADEAGRLAMRKRAYAASRGSIWRCVGQRYLALFDAVARPTAMSRVVQPGPPAGRGRPLVLPAPSLDHLRRLTDDTGLAQHAVLAVVDRAHGYCVDDNARALLLAAALSAPGEQRLPDALTARYAAFVQHAWNPDAGRFRNFMGYDRRWLEDAGSEDSHGRTLWALGEAAASDLGAVERAWAAALFARSLPAVEGFTSPRAWAFALLGLAAQPRAAAPDATTQALQTRLAERLIALLAHHEAPGWTWFEPSLAYDNARLPQALILSGLALARLDILADGLRTLAWLDAVQTAPSGAFRPVGTGSFGEVRRASQTFDQQPVEAAATIAACRAARAASRDTGWRDSAEAAFGWFMGRNDLGLSLVDVETGRCGDGLHPDRINENRGAESVLSYLLALADMRAMRRSDVLRVLWA